MVQIRFTKFGSNSAFGGFAPGDTMRCAPEMARHLVDEVQVAEYMGPKHPAETPEAAPAEPARKRTKKGE